MFFVVKQKTGYEMRISDWSSDVCSSDLFKVAGTSEGITTMQMDIKIAGITRDIFEKALNQAKEGRAHILGEMNKALGEVRSELSAHAPRIETITIDKSKIRAIIGTGDRKSTHLNSSH